MVYMYSMCVCVYVCVCVCVCVSHLQLYMCENNKCIVLQSCHHSHQPAKCPQ